MIILGLQSSMVTFPNPPIVKGTLRSGRIERNQNENKSWILSSGEKPCFSYFRIRFYSVWVRCYIICIRIGLHSRELVAVTSITMELHLAQDHVVIHIWGFDSHVDATITFTVRNFYEIPVLQYEVLIPYDDSCDLELPQYHQASSMNRQFKAIST